MSTEKRTVVAYLALFVAMWLNSRRVYPVAYQWRRVLSLASVAGGLTGLAWALHVSLPVAVALVVAYPLLLAPLGFYLPAERERLRRLLPSRA